MQDVGCTQSTSLKLYDSGQAPHTLCLKGTGTVKLSDLNHDYGWSYTVASFQPGTSPGGYPGLFSKQSTQCTTVACGSQNFTAGEAGPVTLGNFGPGDGGANSDELTLYSLPPFHQAWNGPHTFVVGDFDIPPYEGSATLNASIVIPAILNEAVPVDFIWAGDTYSDCWGQTMDGAVCNYSQTCSAAGLCDGGAGLNAACTSPTYPYCTGPLDGSTYEFCATLPNCPTYIGAWSSTNTAMGISPTDAGPPDSWAPVVGHYQAFNTLYDGVTYSSVTGTDVGGNARCIPGAGGDAGCGMCVSISNFWYPSLTDGGLIPGYAANGNYVDADGGLGVDLYHPGRPELF